MGKIPLNRIVAFGGPYIAILSGAVVDWLFVHLHFLAGFHTNKSAITDWLTQALVFGLTSLLVWFGQQKWLSGWIAYEGRAEQPYEEEYVAIETPPVEPAVPPDPDAPLPEELPGPEHPSETPAHPTEEPPEPPQEPPSGAEDAL